MENGANCSLHGMTVGCVLCTTRSEGTVGQGMWVLGYLGILDIVLHVPAHPNDEGT